LALAGHNGAVSVAVAFTDNQVDGQTHANSIGAYVTTDLFGWGYADAAATFTGNTLKNCDYGLYVENPNDPNTLSSPIPPP